MVAEAMEWRGIDVCWSAPHRESMCVCVSAWKSKECKRESINSIQVPAGGSIHIHTHTHSAECQLLTEKARGRVKHGPCVFACKRGACMCFIDRVSIEMFLFFGVER